jgi:hypothetical protein
MRTRRHEEASPQTGLQFAEGHPALAPLKQTPFPFTASHPPFRIRGWSELLGTEEFIDAADMVRHFLITGETGSGKSVSAVIRLLEAILRYPEQAQYDAYAQASGENAETLPDLRPAILVVDPKHELGDVVEREAGGRSVIHMAYGQSGPVLHLFEGRPLETLEPFEAVDLILRQSDFFVRDQASTREPSWNMQAAALLRDFIAIDMWLARNVENGLTTFWGNVRERLGKLPEFACFMDAVAYDPANYFKPHSTLLGLCSGAEDLTALACYMEAAEELKVPGELYVRLLSFGNLYYSTRSGIVSMAGGILADLAADELAACVSLNPVEPPPLERMLSVKRALERGDLVVYAPIATSPIAEMVGRCLKSKFFEFAFERANKVRPFFYVVDEAHRFLSAGAQDGEQSLLDRCRAFRTGVILATQSIVSMAQRLDSAPGGGGYALQMLLNNCGNALYFRTSDIQTHNNLQQRIPGPPCAGRPHVVQVRPLTTLGVGSCYALRSNGSWGLFQVHLPKSA